MNTPLRFVYFGTPVFAVTIAEMLRQKNILPSLVVTTPEKPVGRKLVLTKTPMHEWAIQHALPVITPATLRNEDVAAQLNQEHADLFIVVAYGKLIPEHILRMPNIATLNIHPSLLPKYRGPSPIESSIVSGDTTTGVTLMELDIEMDHGPILAQEHLLHTWEKENPPKGSLLEHELALLGGDMLIQALPRIEQLLLEKKEQEHAKATMCTKVKKEDGCVDIHGDPILAIQKIRAYDTWPGAYFFLEHHGRQLRIKITDAHISGGKLIIEKVIPEGKKEMLYTDFLRGIH